MLLPESYLRLCETIATSYHFVIFLHDATGALQCSIPQMESEYLDAYREIDMFSLLSSVTTGDRHPRALTGLVSDMWAGFPLADEKGEELFLVIGPVFYTEPTSSTLAELVRAGKLGASALAMFKRHRREVPVMPYKDFSRHIGLLYYVYTGLPFDAMRLGLINNIVAKRVVRDADVDQRVQLSSEPAVHATYAFEEYMLACITEGSVDKLTQHLNNGTTGQTGKLIVGYPLRQEKNMFIVSTTLATRAAIKGGVSPEVALSLSDLLIQKVERMTDIREVFAATAEMLFEFTRRVSDARVSDAYSKTIAAACRYVCDHIYQHIRLHDVATHVNLSESRLSAKFKQETGSTIAEYIRKKKTDEAKALLQRTEFTISEVSELLSFSSQSFFTLVFKHENGVTPKRFREKAADTIVDA